MSREIPEPGDTEAEQRLAAAMDEIARELAEKERAEQIAEANSNAVCVESLNQKEAKS